MGKKKNIIESIHYELPVEIRDELRKFPASKQEEFMKKFQKKKKSIGAAYILWMTLWGNYAYLKKWGLQIFLWFVAGVLCIWWLIDFVRIPKMIRNANRSIAWDILEKLNEE